MSGGLNLGRRRIGVCRILRGLGATGERSKLLQDAVPASAWGSISKPVKPHKPSKEVTTPRQRYRAAQLGRLPRRGDRIKRRSKIPAAGRDASFSI
jgi:hypothetical protein